MAKCPKCSTRKAKRSCPGIGGEICPSCCAENRLKSIPCPQDCRLTYNPDTRRLYVHIFAWPYKHLHLDGFAGKVEYAQLSRLHENVPLRTL
jgi:hypothetical protein